VTDAKDDADGAVFGFRLRVVEFGIDDDRDAIATCDLDLGDLQAIDPPRGFGRD
jgi:hypothetical protein